MIDSHPTRKFATVPDWALEFDDHALTTVTTPECGWCGKSDTVVLPTDDLESWRSGTLIQEAFSYLSPSEREQLMTGIHGKCWDEMFGEED